MASNRAYYYWSQDYKSKSGETLDDCFRKYGTGVQYFKRGNFNLAMECVFLSDEYDFGNSWCMRCYQRESGNNIPVGLYEKNPKEKIFGHHELNPISVAQNKDMESPVKAA